MHGGNDPGASGQGLVEKTVALAVATRVKYHLERNGQTVFVGRVGDTNPSLTERTNIANRNDVAASISIHCNAFNGTAKGAETYTYGTGSNEIKLANCVHGQIIKDKLFILNRGIKQGNLHMVRETNMAAILVELAFIDNVEDAALLRNKQEEFAIAIAKGAISYVGGSWKDEVVSKPPTTTGTMYRVVVGSYTNRKSAEEQQAKLKRDGFSSFLDAFVKDGKNYLRVVAGSYSVRANADEALAKIKAKGYDCFVAIYNGTANTPTPPKPTPPPVVNDDDVIIKQYDEIGYGIPRKTVHVRNSPSEKGASVDTYVKGEKITEYRRVYVTNAYTWISYISMSGVRRYIAVENRKTKERLVDCY